MHSPTSSWSRTNSQPTFFAPREKMLVRVDRAQDILRATFYWLVALLRLGRPCSSHVLPLLGGHVCL